MSTSYSQTLFISVAYKATARSTAEFRFIHTHFTADCHSRGQALYVSISYGFGGAVGGYIAGQLWSQGEGARQAWLFAASIAVVGGVISLLWAPRRDR